MESVEGFIDSIKKWWLKGKDSPSKLGPEPARPTEGWGYEVYREYLLALSRGREFLLPIEGYPSRMELSQPWHEAFNQIRQLSAEGWVLIGFEEGQRRLILPRVAEKGLTHSVPHEVMAAGLDKARAKAGITDLVADAHSHPRNFRHLSWYIPSGETSEGEGAFSLADLYRFLYDLSGKKKAAPRRSAMFVVEGNENIAAFATRGSLETVRNNFSGTYAEFANGWYERYGWTFKGLKPNSQGGGELAEPVRNDAPKAWQINKAIAHRYQIALYRGFKDRPLLRDYPARNTV